jgi:hypothetical protein
MPCKLDENDGIDRFFFPVVKPNIFHERLFQIRWNLMNHKCPCTNCLVKVICLELCSDYKENIIFLAEKIERKNEPTKT